MRHADGRAANPFESCLRSIALEVEVPTARSNALNPFAAAVSLIGALDMMMLGIAA